MFQLAASSISLHLVLTWVTSWKFLFGSQSHPQTLVDTYVTQLPEYLASNKHKAILFKIINRLVFKLLEITITNPHCMTRIQSPIEFFFSFLCNWSGKKQQHFDLSHQRFNIPLPGHVWKQFSLHKIINSFEVALGYKLSAGTKLLNKIASLMN